MTTEKQKLIDKYICRIKIDYPEDDKLMIDLQQFAEEIVKLLDLHGVIKRGVLLSFIGISLLAGIAIGLIMTSFLAMFL